MTMSGTRTRTKLVIHSHDKNTTYQDTIEVNSWKDVSLIHLKTDIYQEDLINALAARLTEHAAAEGKPAPFIIYGPDFDVDVYYLEEYLPEFEQLELW